MPSHRFGFTLIELLISTAIFALVIIAFIGVFVAVVGVQTRQSSSAAVNEESQFLLQKIQYYVELSSFVSTTQDLAASTLTLRMPSSSIDPTVISLAGGTVYLQQAGGALQPLTSNKVVVSNLAFTRRSNAPGHDSVSVSFTLSYNTASIKQMFVQALQTSVARVSAATFDSNVLPSTAGTLNLGASGQTWASVNGILDFSSGNVGINAASPQQAFEVNGGVRLNTVITQPTCDSSARGTLWYLERATSANDILQICTENASSTYSWLTVSNQWAVSGAAIYYTGGNVGIGTASPAARLDVASANSTSTGLQVVSNFYSDSSASVDQDFGGMIQFWSKGQSPSQWKKAAIGWKNDPGTTAWGNLLFYMPNTSNNLQEVMRINYIGNVGIGTTGPTNKLTVLTTGTGDTPLIIGTSANSGSNSTALQFETSNAFAGGTIGARIRAVQDEGAQYNMALHFDTYSGTYGQINDVMTITSNGVSSATGKVGIGVTSPGGSLDVERANDSGVILRLGDGSTSNFDLARSATTGALSIQGNQTGYTNIVLAPTSGNVGIGTTAPNSKLEVTNGDIDISTAANGLILKDTVSGTCARVQLTNGVLVPTTVTCP